MTEVKRWWIAAFLSLGLVPFTVGPANSQEQLLIGTWGGQYEAGQQKVFFKPFEQLSKIAVQAEPHGGNLFKLIAKQISNQHRWDVLDLDQANLEKACETGFLSRLDQATLAPGIGGLSPEEDFLPGGIHECGFAHSVWSKIFAVKLSSFIETPPPKSIPELFDSENYPGGRGFFKTPEGLMELALLADGLVGSQVYEVLATKEGQQRALTKLGSIRKEIIWLKSSQQGLDLLQEGKIKVTQGFHNEMLPAASNQENSIALLWDQQLLAMSYWAVVAASSNHEKALEFIGFATSPGATASQASFLGYGPSRVSAQSLVREDLRPYMPTHGDHLDHAFVIDFSWWDREGRAAKSAFWTWYRLGIK